MKKLINTIKTALKKNTDMKATVNEVIKLKNWEKDFLDVIKKDENPVFSKVPGALSCGVKIHAENETETQIKEHEITYHCAHELHKSSIYHIMRMF